MTNEEIEKEAIRHCDEVMCSICEKGSCPPLKKCKEWRDRRAGYYCGIESREKRIEELEQQIEKMKKYIKACWVEENLNDYSSYITNSSDEFIDLVKELNAEVRNGR